MLPVSRFSLCSAAIAFSALSAFAQQNVISAKSGLVHYIEGDVAVDGTPVSDKAGVFTSVKKDSELATTLGRAEVLLTPGVFLRVGEQSSIKMLNTSLADTRIQFLSGNALVESDTPMKGNQVTVLYKDYEATFPKHGLFEFKSEPAQLKVFKGDAIVSAGGQTVTVHEGHTVYLTAALAEAKFNPEQGDSLYRWAKTRSEYVSTANVSAAQAAQGYGYNNFTGSNGGLGGFNGGLGGNWFYNPYYGMYTFLPYDGIAYSPFGYAYYSPYTVYQAYAPYTNTVPVKNPTKKATGTTTIAARTNHAITLASVSRPSSAPRSAPASFGTGGGGSGRSTLSAPVATFTSMPSGKAK